MRIPIKVKAVSLLRERYRVGGAAFVELRVWQVPVSVRGSVHEYKYALAYIVKEKCVLRYDNEAGKGDHRHIGEFEEPYRFTTMERLLTDFRRDVENWRPL